MSKTLLCILIAVLLLLPTSCQSNRYVSDDDARLTLTAYGFGAAVVVKNLSDGIYRAGRAYAIEHWKNGQWESVPLLPFHENEFGTDTVDIKPLEEWVFCPRYAAFDFDFVPGLYRIIYSQWNCEFTIEERTGDAGNGIEAQDLEPVDWSVEIFPHDLTVSYVTDETTIFVVKNISGRFGAGVSGYTLEYRDGQDWVVIPNLPNHGASRLMLSVIAPDEEIMHTLRFSHFDFTFTPGDYRLVYEELWGCEFTITRK